MIFVCGKIKVDDSDRQDREMLVSVCGVSLVRPSGMGLRVYVDKSGN